MFRRICGWLGVVATMAFLAGCGGGDSGGCMLPACVPGGDVPDDGTTTYSLSLRAADQNTGLPFFSGGTLVTDETLVITAIMTDDSGNTIANQTVNFGQSSTLLAQSNQTAVTNAAGQAIITVTPLVGATGSVSLTAYVTLAGGSTQAVSASLTIVVKG